MQKESPRYCSLDRVMTQAFVEMARRRKAAMNKRQSVLVPRCAVNQLLLHLKPYSSDRMDLCDDPENTRLIATFEVPGVRLDQLSVRVEGTRLIVEGERPGPSGHPIAARCSSTSTLPSIAPTSSKDSRSSSYVVQELKYGSFKRTIGLPAGIEVRFNCQLFTADANISLAGHRCSWLACWGDADGFVAPRFRLSSGHKGFHRTCHDGQ